MLQSYFSQFFESRKVMASSETSVSTSSGSWHTAISAKWDVLGPFPMHAREQNSMSPSFPIRIQEPIDYSKTWPSSYADGGMVSWDTTESTEDGQIKVAFPNIRWQSLRATEGWAALQHHAILRGTLTVFPPTQAVQDGNNPRLRLLVQLLQGSFFAIVPANRGNFKDAPAGVPMLDWYHGNIYAMERAIPQAVNLPTSPSLTEPTEYDIFVSGDYEIRLFGDPSSYDSQHPIQSLQISVDVEQLVDQVVREPTQDVVCDFVGGYSFGYALGIGLRSVDGWWSVKRATLVASGLSQFQGLTVGLKEEIRIAPSQTRIVPLFIEQTEKFLGEEIQLLIEVELLSKGFTSTMAVTLQVNHLASWDSESRDAHYAIKASYFYAESMPTNFIAIPPLSRNTGELTKAPILCLHGAGVDIIGTPWWSGVLPRFDHSWLVLPTGRTSWGLDWHGPSAKDAWGSLDALVYIVKQNPSWERWKLPDDPSAVVLGHSNGGQGAWYLASRYPDRVLAVAPMAAYIKSQAYVPWTQSRSAHYTDPALRSILQTALTPDDNDLFMSNLTGTPVLAIHGGLDENVPVWHSREYISILKTLQPDAEATLREDPGQPHWYDSAVSNPNTVAFLEEAVNLRRSEPPREFTLNVASPSETGALFGFRILALKVPGRLGRLKVRVDERGFVHVSTANIDTLQVDLNRLYTNASRPTQLFVDGTLRKPSSPNSVYKNDNTTWNLCEDECDAPSPQLSGRAQQILTTNAPLAIVIPDDESSHELSVALRVAHNLNTYHRIDSSIVKSAAALDLMQKGSIRGNIISIGTPFTPFNRFVLAHNSTPFTIREDKLLLNGHRLPHANEGVLFLHPHPCESSAIMLMVLGQGSGLERAFRQVPLRTGLPTPDWLVMTAASDHLSEGGIAGAGVWGRLWSWNEPMSWLY